MLYQKLLSGEKPYYINIGRRVTGFVEHRHPELEFCWCIEGELFIDIDKRSYGLKAGQLAIVGSMASHSLPKDQPGTGIAMTIVCGPTLLLGFLNRFPKRTSPNRLSILPNIGSLKIFCTIWRNKVRAIRHRRSLRAEVSCTG